MRLSLITCLLVLASACGDDGEALEEVFARGQLQAVANVDVDTVLDATLLADPSGRAVLFLVHEGALSIGETRLGSPGEIRLLALGFDVNLEVRWARDYGPAADLTLAGAIAVDDRIELVLGAGTLESPLGEAPAPATLRLSNADGVLLALIDFTALGDESPTRIDQLLERDGAIGLIGTQGTTPWVGRYQDSLVSTQRWTQAFDPQITPLTGGFDADGNLALLFSGSSDTLPSSTSRSLAELGASAGDILWQAEASPDSKTMSVAPSGSVVVVHESDAPTLQIRSGSSGTLDIDIPLTADTTTSFAVVDSCAGSGDNAVATVGDFSGTLVAGETQAEASSNAMFLLKHDEVSGEPVYLRWSESALEVRAQYIACADDGSVIGGGFFVDDGGVPTLFLLQLAP